MSPPKNYVWKPIEPWTIKWHKSYLPEAFAEFKKYLTDTDLHRLMERSAREWSIETGIIENAFELSRGVTTALIEHGFNASLIEHQRNGLTPEQVHAILLDTKEALEGLFEFVKSAEPLTTSYIRQLHQQLMRNVEKYQVQVTDPLSGQRRLENRKLEPGKYKVTPNNPSRDDGSVHEYCPPAQVHTQMEALVSMFKDLDSTTAPEVRAAWLHHSFAQIHPFQDGNGRVARALASLVLIKSGLPPLTVPREMRSRYLNSLELADRNDPKELLEFFESCLYRELVRWRNPVNSAAPEFNLSTDASVEELVRAAEARLASRDSSDHAAWRVGDAHLPLLRGLAASALQAIGNSFQRFRAPVFNEIRLSNSSFWMASLERWGPLDRPIGVVTATRLTIMADHEAEIYVAFDSFDEHRGGLAGAAVVLVYRAAVVPIEPSFFFNFADPDPEPRFIEWLNTALKLAILEWQKRIT